MKKSSSILNVSLESNNIGDGGMMKLAKALEENSSLKQIYLRDNQFTNSAMITLALELVSANNIVGIDLSDNIIGDRGVDSLASHLTSEGLKEINFDLRGNSITRKGAQTVMNVWQARDECIGEILFFDEPQSATTLWDIVESPPPPYKESHRNRLL